MKYIILIAVSVIVTGCSSLTDPARKHELDIKKSYWMDYDASRRGALLFGADSSWKACAEPAPDVAIGIVAKLAGKGEFAQSIVNLAEKTQMVLFLRESLFRLCELSINTNITVDETKDLYKTVIDTALELVKNETAEIILEQQQFGIIQHLSEKKYQPGDKYQLEKEVDQSTIQTLLKNMQ